MAKHDIDENMAIQLLTERLNKGITAITRLEGGNMNDVFSFEYEGKRYVARFSESANPGEGALDLTSLLAPRNLPVHCVFHKGRHDKWDYTVTNWLAGDMLARMPEPQRGPLLPELIDHLITLHGTPLPADCTGFGHLQPSMRGSSASWEEHVRSFFAAKQEPGNFWDNWTGLYDTSCLERPVIEELLAKLYHYMPFNAPYRHLVHNDFHEWNILTDGRSITGIIDGSWLIGDFLIDLVTVRDAFPGTDVFGTFRARYESIGQPIAHFEERLIGANLYKGIDALRFYAKMGWDHAYFPLRDELLGLGE